MTGTTTACTCCADLMQGRFDRRYFLRAAGAGGLAFALQPYSVFAAEGKYEAMVLSCIDPRFQKPVADYMAKRKLTGKFSHFVIAGAGVGVVAPAFNDWHKTFWDNLDASIQLHRIKSVIVINHRDCGAAKIAYGAEKVANPQAETETHRGAVAEFRKQLAEKHPSLGVETGLMALRGRVEALS